MREFDLQSKCIQQLRNLFDFLLSFSLSLSVSKLPSSVLPHPTLFCVFCFWALKISDKLSAEVSRVVRNGDARKVVTRAKRRVDKDVNLPRGKATSAKTKPGKWEHGEHERFIEVRQGFLAEAHSFYSLHQYNGVSAPPPLSCKKCQQRTCKEHPKVGGDS